MFYLVIGLGKSGYFAAKYLQKNKYKIAIFDDDESKYHEEKITAILANGAEVFNEQKHLSLIKKAILSPGVPVSHYLVKQLKLLNISVISEIEFGLSLTKNKKIAVTGTNGKSTVCSLISHVLNYMKIPSICVGNIGYPITKYLDDPDDRKVLIVELSSFQLESFFGNHFDIGLILNIYPHHLDRYSNFNAYAYTKVSLQSKVKKLYVSSAVSDKFKSQLNNHYVYDTLDWEDTNFLNQNLDAAFSVCKSFQIDKLSFRSATKSFQNLAHRMEKVATIKQISYFNDSKATNAFAVIQAVKRLNKNIVLIAGGYDSLNDFKIWRKSFINKVKTIIAIGESRAKIFKTLSDMVEVVLADNLNVGFEKAILIARKNDIILFSPGCQSYDQFKNFEDRGDAFKQLVMAQKERE